ncbi:MAG: HlyD family efflux transporter periplasmic adaptor subunit [Sedimentisphaerales bacterium]|nr:HlyD family efflux transporter periplasmic adaptor subunit [Sedimentisphaerales bacterium]
MSENPAQKRLTEVLTRIAQLPSENLEPPQFFANFLQLTIAATGSRGGAIWITQANQPPQCYCHVDLELCNINDQSQQQLIGEAVAKTAAENRVLVLPSAGDGGGAPATDAGGEQTGSPEGRRNQCNHALFFKPLRAADRVGMVLQLVAAEGLAQSDYQAVVGLANKAGEAAENYLAHRRAAVLEDDRKSLARLLQYAEKVHGSLEPDKVIYEVANLGRDAISCDRMMVWIDPQVKRGLRAVSGIDKPDHRAVLMQAVEKLCKHCLQIKQPVVASRARLVEMPEEEELTELVRHYFNVSQLDTIFLQPIPRGEDSFAGVVVAEGVDEQASVNLAGMMATVAKHAGVALENALMVGSLSLTKPFAKLRAKAQNPKNRRKRNIILIVILLILITAILMPWPVKIDCTCELSPAVMRVVDSPLDGVQIVNVLRVRGQVDADEVVVQLNSDELQTQYYAREAALEQERTRLRLIQRTASEAEVQHCQLQIQRLEHELEFFAEQIAKCDVRSPIAGTILTDRLDLREGMTVARGDVIFEVADLTDWELVLNVPQAEIGWLLRAIDEQLAEPADTDEQQGLLVEFYLTAYPEQRLRGWITDREQIGQMGQVRDEGNVFSVRVRVDPAELEPIMNGLRDGSVGRAKVTTSSHPLGYVLLRKIIRFFRVTFF